MCDQPTNRQSGAVEFVHATKNPEHDYFSFAQNFFTFCLYFGPRISIESWKLAKFCLVLLPLC